MAKESTTAAKAPEPVQVAPNRQLMLDESKTVSHYSNFCRVTGTPEELIVDFGLNAQPLGSTDRPIQIVQRTVLNYYTAKRLLHALHVAVRRHEEAFGELEIDIQKRAQNNAS